MAQPEGRTPQRLPRYRTGDRDLDARIVDLLDAIGVEDDRDQLFEIFAAVVRLAGDKADRLDLKITNSAVREMREAFQLFAPYKDVPKVTMFGSARTLPDDPLYGQARGLAAALAGMGWMIVTGAGPGIMAAGAEGAGDERSIGVTIRLPFEAPNPVSADNPRLVEMKYFFTRKLMLIKESAGFAVLPGGFGTLDEAFELLTLLQTGKAVPVPVVLLEVPGGTYWHSWQHFVEEVVTARGLVSADDLCLYRIADDVQEAVGELTGFYRNYHSSRWVGNDLVIRLRRRPSDGEMRDLNREFATIAVSGGIRRTRPRPPEVADNEHLDLPRIALRFDKVSYGRLRLLIDRLNELAS